jgi:hypothetical protein
MEINQKRAREIMGKNFFGVEEWSILYDVKFSQKQLRQAAEFPWGEDILNSTCPFCGKVVKECHFAFLGLHRTLRTSYIKPAKNAIRGACGNKRQTT